MRSTPLTETVGLCSLELDRGIDDVRSQTSRPE